MTTPEKKDVKQVIREEYQRCAGSPQYFIRKYVMIQHPKKGRMYFDLYKYQHEAIDAFEKFDLNIILKGRQIGISTAVAAYALWMMLFHKDKNILVIATKQDTAKNLVAKVKFAFDQLPVWLQVPCTENNKLSLKFKNGSQIKADTANDEAGRSEALSLLILDEAAFIRNAESIWTAALPTLSTGGKAVLISTPNGMGNFFHKKWTQAKNDEAEEVSEEALFKFNPILLDWRVHPDRDQAWRDRMGKLQGEEKARQEYDAEFLGSGATVVDAYLIEEYANLIKDKWGEQPPFKRGIGNNLWVWETPDRNRSYMISADVARGDGGDYSTAHVIDLVNCTQVAEFRGKIQTTEFGDLLYVLGAEYFDALVVVERENQGWSVIQRLIDRSYKNLFYMSSDMQVLEPDRQKSNKLYAEQKKMVPGFTTSVKTRPVIISKLNEYMREKAVEIRSMRTIEELRVFIWEKGKAQAMEGYNDDLVMALAIGLWVRDTALVLHRANTEYTKTALNNIHRVGGFDGIYTTPGLTNDPYKMPLGGGEGTDAYEDLRWLIS